MNPQSIWPAETSMAGRRRVPSRRCVTTQRPSLVLLAASLLSRVPESGRFRFYVFCSRWRSRQERAGDQVIRGSGSPEFPACAGPAPPARSRWAIKGLWRVRKRACRSHMQPAGWRVLASCARPDRPARQAWKTAVDLLRLVTSVHRTRPLPRLLDVFPAFKETNFRERFMHQFPWPSWSKALD